MSVTEAWRHLAPLAHVLVRYADDREYWHHRVLLVHVGNDIWLVVTPFRDIFHMKVSAPPLEGVLAWDGSTLPQGVAREECILDEDEAGGVFRLGELRECTLRAANMVTEARRERRLPDLSEGSYRCM